VSEDFDKNLVVKEGKRGEWHNAEEVVLLRDISPNTNKVVNTILRRDISPNTKKVVNTMIVKLQAV
jgi:hypothetical protein